MANVKVFKSKSDGPGIEIAGVGYVGPDGKGGVRVDQAAQVMSELQEREEDGSLKLDDDGQPIPLTGSALTKAADDYAEIHDLTVKSISEDKAAQLPAELGVAADRPPAREVSIQAYEDSGLAELEAENTPEEMADIGTGEEQTPTTAADDGEATA